MFIKFEGGGGKALMAWSLVEELFLRIPLGKAEFRMKTEIDRIQSRTSGKNQIQIRCEKCTYLNFVLSIFERIRFDCYRFQRDFGRDPAKSAFVQEPQEKNRNELLYKPIRNQKKIWNSGEQITRERILITERGKQKVNLQHRYISILRSLVEDL